MKNKIKFVRVKTRPTKGMFVPCNEKDEVLTEPHCYDGFMEFGAPVKLECSDLLCECDQYSQAQDRVIFKGFEVAENGDIWNPELKRWAFVKGEKRYQEIFKSVFSVLKVGIETRDGVGIVNEYMPEVQDALDYLTMDSPKGNISDVILSINRVKE